MNRLDVTFEKNEDLSFFVWMKYNSRCNRNEIVFKTSDWVVDSRYCRGVLHDVHVDVRLQRRVFH
jgi:hypothetical protein